MGVLADQLQTGALGERDYGAVEPFANLFYVWSSWAYIKGYQEQAAAAPFVPKDTRELRVLLDAFRLEKALWQLEYELDRDPAGIHIPLHEIDEILAFATTG
jgi:maltose alpha-D-glucosyltransferase/alpha-amylase